MEVFDFVKIYGGRGLCFKKFEGGKAFFSDNHTIDVIIELNDNTSFVDKYNTVEYLYNNSVFFEFKLHR